MPPPPAIIQPARRHASFVPGWFPGATQTPPTPTTCAWTAAGGMTTSPNNTYTATSQALGTAAASRNMYVIIHSTSANVSTVGDVTAVTIAGISATKVYTNFATSNAGDTIWTAPVPTGTTGNLVINRVTGNGFIVVLWSMFAVYDVFITLNPTVTRGTVADPSVASITKADHGSVLCWAAATNTSTSFTWTNATKTADQLAGVSNTSRISAAIISDTTAGGISITAKANAAVITQNLIAVIR